MRKKKTRMPPPPPLLLLLPLFQFHHHSAHNFCRQHQSPALFPPALFNYWHNIIPRHAFTSSSSASANHSFRLLLLLLLLFVSMLPATASASRYLINNNSNNPVPPSSSSSSTTCTFEPSSQSPSGVCAKWSFFNSDQLQQMQQQQQQQPHGLLLHPDVSNVGTSSSATANNSKRSNNNNNFYVVLSGGGNASNHYAYYQAMLPPQPSSSASSSASSLPAVAMVVSPFWEHTAPQCELYFRYRVLGAPGAELLVASEQQSLRHPNLAPNDEPLGNGNGNNNNNGMVEEEDEEDWTRPTLRARFEPGNPPMSVGEPWAQARVPLGQFNFPTRIRVECHSANSNGAAATNSHYPNKYGATARVGTVDVDDGSDGGAEPVLSVECSVDDLQLVNCGEVEWHDTASSGGDGVDEEEDVHCPPGRIPCRSHNYYNNNNNREQRWRQQQQRQRHICLRQDQLCDMHPDCREAEDELEQLHKCSQVPDGARCDFEDLRWLPAGCAHWRFYSSQTGGGNPQQQPMAVNSSYSSAGGSVPSPSFSLKSSSLLAASPSATAVHHLVSLADAQTRRPGIPPGEYWHESRLYRVGHFLFFSSYDHPGSGQHDIIYSFAMSAPLPLALPMAFYAQHKQQQQVEEQQQQQQQECSLRFFYCQTGFSPFQVFLQRRDQPQELAKPLWAPPRDEHVREPCEWHRAAVPIQRAQLAPNGEYALKLSFAKLAGSMGSIAIDDLSLHPQCFANGGTGNSHVLLLPSKLSIEADELQKEENNIDNNDVPALLHWIVPTSGEYRFVLAGAAGGQLAGGTNPAVAIAQQQQSRETWADRLVANAHLSAGQQLGLLLGRSGQCHCENDGGWARKTTSGGGRDEVKLVEKECNASGWHACGGGGASVLFLGGSPIAIAAGGGGDFAANRAAATTAAGMARNARPNVLVGKGLELMEHIAGPAQQRLQQICVDPCIDGHVGVNVTQLLGGKCPQHGGGTNSQMAANGGYGGGGASCGAGGGGGAGYRGGAAGIFAVGNAGTSAFFPTAPTSSIATKQPKEEQQQQQLIVARSNGRQGHFRLIACPQRECPPTSRCTFGVPVKLEEEETALPKCICPDGRAVPIGTTTCARSSSDLAVGTLLLLKLFGNEQPQRAEDPVPSLLLIACILLFLFSLCLTILCCVQLCRCLRRRRRRKLLGCETAADVHELIAIAAESAGGPAAGENMRRHCGIVGNPIYESLNLNPLPQIPRHSLRLDKIIGHGAFGEVFEGWLCLNNNTGGDAQTITTTTTTGGDGDENQCIAGGGGGGGQQEVKVAVKSLPIESANDFGDDFEMEARLLSQFKHENIVTLFGVCFEQQPKYIVLEFLEGGDLKNFLRENRPRQDQEPMLRMGDLMAFALDVARACEHLESTRFVHRDIAARNCLLTAKVGRRMVKIADFGMARDIYRNDYYRKGGKAFLPVRWMPPESFLDGLFTSKTDVWAFGVLLWEIFSMGYIPYSGRENHEVMRLVVAGNRLDRPIGVLNEVYDLMLLCWNTEAERRPRFSELVCTFEALLRRPELANQPLPPIRHRLANERSISGTPSMSRAGDPHPASTTSQATVSTVLSHSAAPEAAVAFGGGGGGSTTTSTYESMPTAGDGVCRAVFPPYQSRQIDETGALIQCTGGGLLPPLAGTGTTTGMANSYDSNSCTSSGSQDETLHESAATVKLRNCIRWPPTAAPTITATTAAIVAQKQQQQTTTTPPPPIIHTKPSIAKKPAPLNLLVLSNFNQPQQQQPQQQQQQQLLSSSAAIQPGPSSAIPWSWRRPSTTPTAATTTTTTTTAFAAGGQHQQQQQPHRNHSLPPTTSSGRIAAKFAPGMAVDGGEGDGGGGERHRGDEGDRDSGIASARSFASADAAL